MANYEIQKLIPQELNPAKVFKGEINTLAYISFKSESYGTNTVGQIYELHEFDPVKVFTKEINTLEVNSFKYEAYGTNTVGQIVIDKNNTIEGKRKFISLATKKTSQTKFNQVIDIDFTEFTAKNALSSLESALDFLRAKISSLETDKASLKSGRDTDRQKIDQLNKQIAALLEQINQLLAKQKEENKIPNHLNVNETLQVGPEVNELPVDRIMSKNKKYIAVIQSDRNFVIYSGEFDNKGYPLENTAIEAVWTAKNSFLPKQGNYILKFYTHGLAAYQYAYRANQTASGKIIDWQWLSQHEYVNTNAIPAGLALTDYTPYIEGTLSDNAQLILEDSGNLVITSNSVKIQAEWNL